MKKAVQNPDLGVIWLTGFPVAASSCNKIELGSWLSPGSYVLGEPQWVRAAASTPCMWGFPGVSGWPRCDTADQTRWTFFGLIKKVSHDVFVSFG